MYLETKFLKPTIPKGTLLRARLVEGLQSSLDKPLILLSAPAGYGKTTLLSHFIANTPVPVVWYQLDPQDNDPAVFFDYLVECIHRCFPSFGTISRGMLQSAKDVAQEWQRFLVILINELMKTVPEDVLLVLEDYHFVDNPVVHAFVDRILAEAPPHLHILLSTRSDPLISLARLRARRQVVEIRARDLQISKEEAIELVNLQELSDLPPDSVRDLVVETEGWAAAFQLALSALLGTTGVSVKNLIASLRGANRYLFDYLSEEVLAAESEELRSFLLGSSILAQMSPDLCDSVLGISNSQQILETLVKKNLFTLALDDQHQWFRYHQLFREMLQEQLLSENGDRVRDLHLNAVDFFEVAGDFGQAVFHCQKAGDTERLADLIERAGPEQLARGRLCTLQRWIETLPDEVLTGRPWLNLYRSQILTTQGKSQDARFALRQARRSFKEAGDEIGESRVLSQFCRVAFFEGRYEQSKKLNHEALRRMPWRDHVGRAQALRSQAELWVYLGNSKRAVQAMERSFEHVGYLDRPAILAEQAIFLGGTYRTAGQLSQALRTLQRGLDMLGDEEVFGAHIAHSQIGAIYLERWELDKAVEHYQTSLELSQRFQDSAWMIYADYCLGIIYAELDQLAESQEHFDAALKALEQTGLASLLAEGAWNYRAEAYLKAGRYIQAEACSRKAIAARGEELGGLAWGMGWLPLAKTYLATGRLEEAERILSDVEKASEQGGNALSLIDSAFNLGRVCLEKGKADEAKRHLQKSLGTAAAQGHRWIFVSLGEKALPGLTFALKRQIEPAFVQTLLDLLGLTLSPGPDGLPSHPAAGIRPLAGELPPFENKVPANVLQVTCFGEFQLSRVGRNVGNPGWLATKAGHLFAYFITNRDRSVPRDRILEALWPGADPRRSVGAFHTSLYEMRSMLRVNGDKSKFVHTKSGEYYLEKDRFWIDAEEFERAMRQCKRHSHAALERCESCVHRLEQAVDLYQGEFLESLYEDWVLETRHYLKSLYLKALDTVASFHVGQGDLELAVGYYQKMLAKDPLQEAVHSQVMDLYARLGDRSALIKQYRHMEEVLADELGVEPMLETRHLYHSLIGA